jgi:hypothetical protein
MPFELLRNLPKKADDLVGIQASYWGTGVNWSGAITLPPNVGTVLGVYNPSFISTFGLSHARFSRLGAKFLEKMAALRVATISGSPSPSPLQTYKVQHSPRTSVLQAIGSFACILSSGDIWWWRRQFMPSGSKSLFTGTSHIRAVMWWLVNGA